MRLESLNDPHLLSKAVVNSTLMKHENVYIRVFHTERVLSKLMVYWKAVENGENTQYACIVVLRTTYYSAEIVGLCATVQRNVRRKIGQPIFWIVRCSDSRLSAFAENADEGHMTPCNITSFPLQMRRLWLNFESNLIWRRDVSRPKSRGQLAGSNERLYAGGITPMWATDCSKACYNKPHKEGPGSCFTYASHRGPIYRPSSLLLTLP